jgi:Zn-dependent peptidase ImmA (M78 family)
MQRSRNKPGQSKFPPNPTQWNAERNGHSIRSQFGKALHLPLEPFDVASRMPGVKLLTREEFEGVVGKVCTAALFGPHRDAWSGFVVPVDGLHLIVLNSTHAPSRQHATLTEELFHIRLRHKPCRLSPCPVSGMMRREFTREIEEEAYHSAAAALVPYFTLKELVKSGETIESIAEFFHVSVKLVPFRINVTRLVRRSRTPR